MDPYRGEEFKPGKEIAGDTAIYANPNDVNSIANAMEEMYSNDDKRNELIVNCKIRKTAFSWDKAASEVWEILEQNLPC